MRQKHLDLVEPMVAKCLMLVNAKIPFRFLVARIRKRFWRQSCHLGAGDLRRSNWLASGPKRSAISLAAPLE
jgi:hypothetical protein